jgi:hypothetical protein
MPMNLNNRIFINQLLKNIKKLKEKKIRLEKLKIGFYSKEIKLSFLIISHLRFTTVLPWKN